MRFPAAFVTDFGPLPALEADAYTEALGKLGTLVPKPKAVVVMSGHWEAEGIIAVSSAKKPGVLYDFTGFPNAYYQFKYACPGHPATALEVIRLLSAAGVPAKADAARPLDHGAWVPLSRMYPKANVPVVQIAVPAGDPRLTFRIGQALSPLRDKGVLLIGSGALSHNLQLALAHGKDDSADKWATDFDTWISDKLSKGLAEDLFNYRSQAPSARLAAPTSEHFNPFFFALGAASREPMRQAYRGIAYGNALMKILISGTLPEL